MTSGSRICRSTHLTNKAPVGVAYRCHSASEAAYCIARGMESSRRNSGWTRPNCGEELYQKGAVPYHSGVLGILIPAITNRMKKMMGHGRLCGCARAGFAARRCKRGETR